MGTKLDVPLDDLIKNNKAAAFRGRPRPPGPARGVPFRAFNRVAPYSKPAPAPDTVWKHDLFRDQMVRGPAMGGAGEAGAGAKLYISNLDYGVSNDDVKELFSEVGELKQYAIHYDKSGRSKGTAEVVFQWSGDAIAAVKRYNGVQLDGKPMKIETVGKNITAPTILRKFTNGAFGISKGIYKSAFGMGGPIRPMRSDRIQPMWSGPVHPMRSSRGGGRGGGRDRGGRDRGHGRDRGPPASAADLDADLENYHMEAMQTT